MALFDLMLALPPVAFILLVALFGLFVGSFLNVVIARLPVMLERRWAAECAELRGEEIAPCAPFNLMVPRSRCPQCGAAIRPWHNIPLLGWLSLRGRCADCQAPIPLRYPLVELVTGVLFAVLAWRFGPSVMLAGSLLLAGALIALTFIDADTQLLPDDITLPLIWAGLLFHLLTGILPLSDVVAGAMAGYLSLWSVYWAFKLVTGKEGMGYGDFKLLAALGAWLGWQMLPLIILLSSLVGALWGIAMMAAARLGRGQPLPFGPYLAAAGLIALIWGPAIVGWYLGGL
ncbi:prepilin peptidase [Craterilacuibacter sinensis]|uniref:Prepilin leader peptidase/N-methyltransferase n=1 Tax=Craterilacuibacter sinensis TaxID=2686017 RepID=A0A845BSR9_9NEIS|nr:A24 family peptidase [Craterilacuibacter sinensis]MXR37601.1 prepilin peptidase [Craterilacuibacter sinensis]